MFFALSSIQWRVFSPLQLKSQCWLTKNTIFNSIVDNTAEIIFDVKTGDFS